ncbi:MAG: type IV pilin protein [Roseateles asaccharophilus]|uniref:type IV pilin protein n=1 Tax=Roseateles asaccharophilus TaxID=582607 RepID=UPI00391A4CDA
MTRKIPYRTRSRTRGFTLIEVMVVVVIVGILSAFAYPAYTDYVLRGHLVDASTGLATMRAQMERHYQDNRSYATVGSFTTPCRAQESGRTFGRFVVSCAGDPTATTYTLQATGSGPANGFIYRVTEMDVRSTHQVPSGKGYNTCASRWLMKKGEAC